MYAEFEVHRTMICDRVRTGAFRRAIDSVVRPGDIVLDVGAGSGILSVFAARAGAARVYAVERTSAAVLAQELAAANGVAESVQVIHGDVMDARQRQNRSIPWEEIWQQPRIQTGAA
jgi:predicted RNA methylase